MNMLNTRRTVADLGMRDSARHLSYGCATGRGVCPGPSASAPEVVAPRVDEVERALFASGGLL